MVEHVFDKMGIYTCEVCNVMKCEQKRIELESK